MKLLQYCGLRSSTVHLIEASTQPANKLGSDGNVHLAMDSKYNLTRFLAGGGLCLAHTIESGVLSKLWQDGIRWMLCGELEYPSAIAESPLVARLKNHTCDGLVEVVEHAELPESLVLPLNASEKNVCVDKRRLNEETLARLGALDLVCNGTFWLRCEKLALTFGVTRQNLEEKWDTSVWENKIEQKIIEKYEMFVQHQDGLLAANWPLWEVLSDLNLEFCKVNLQPKQ